MHDRKCGPLVVEPLQRGARHCLSHLWIFGEAISGLRCALGGSRFPFRWGLGWTGLRLGVTAIAKTAVFVLLLHRYELWNRMLVEFWWGLGWGGVELNWGGENLVRPVRNHTGGTTN